MGDNGKKVVGAALVVGGGVGGMQAALDLAESGIKVYLVESQPCIGGVMSQLDKTFPTNDCSMCIVSPRLVDVGRHLNIETITNADIMGIQGETGSFSVNVRKRARYIRLDRCTGCGLCVEKCPVKLGSEFDMGMAERRAIYRRYPQAVPSAFSIEKTGKSPCKMACPLMVNAHGYVTLIAQRRFKEALEVERRANPFPAICGRICPHACETECRRGALDESISIAGLKRFLADWEAAHPLEMPPIPQIQKKGKKVAVVGSGPAGLACARDLALAGYDATVFEALPEPGGMLRYGIPEYRLPKATLKREIEEAATRFGVEIRCNTRIGRDIGIEDLNEQGYEAIFLAIGAHVGLALGVPGENEFKGVVDAAQFLRDLNLGKGTKISGKVVIVGGGNVAIDAARSSIRLGASEVTIVYRRSRKEMPANPWEIEEAEHEGVKILYLAAPTKVLGSSGKVTGIECVKMELGEPDASGRRRPVPVPGSEFVVETDLVIPAISQQPDLAEFAAQGLASSKWGMFEVDGVTLETNISGVFAGGDAVSGPATAVEAIEAGRRAAESIIRYLEDRDMREGREIPEWTKAVKDIEGLAKEKRVRMRTIAVEERKGNFKEVELGYTEEEAVREAQRCLNCATCCECLMCVAACEAKAIDHDMPADEAVNLNVGAVILAPGFDLFSPEVKKEFGYERYPNVITSLEFERILSASGPFMGKIKRLSDGATPRKIAFIQCVGSRDVENNYCSSVCCMYATKEAVIAMEHEPGLECHIFYIDLRAFGKGFDEYCERAKHHGVKYTRCRPSSIKEVPATKNLKMQYQAEDGKLAMEEFDMVVLSSGLRPPRQVAELAKTLGVELNPHGFASTERFTPVETSRKGIYVCGPFAEPKDIPETVTQASGAAAEALGVLAPARGTLVRKKEYPEEKDIRGQEPRVGVFVCHCGKNIGGVVDVPALAEYVKTLPCVVYAEHKLYTCSQDSIKSIKEKVAEHNLNRVVVASCTPRTHEPLFQDSIREVGLNPYLFEMANIRDQCTWVHMHENQKAFEKSKDLIRMAVYRARFLSPLYKESLDINRNVLVIGGGISGLTCALNLADQGFSVFLVEKEKELGGNLRNIHFLLGGKETKAFLNSVVERVKAHKGIALHTQSKVTAFSGFIGNFNATISAGGNGTREIQCGAVVVATGGTDYKPKEYLYGEDKNVLTQLELEKLIHDNPEEVKKFRELVMIQCVGSRSDERPYCSRICCSEAIKNALLLREINPSVRVYVLYRDVRTYGFREEYYRQARQNGILFMRYEKDQKPEVAKKGESLEVRVKEQVLGMTFVLKPDRLVLSAATLPDPTTEELGKLMKLPLTQDKFFLEAHMKLRPVDFASDGIFLCGLAHYPKFVDESIAQAFAAASRVSTILAKPYLTVGGAVAKVNPDLCAACLTCVRMCPYEVPKIEDGVASINTALCQGCGTCAAACSAKAIQVLHSTDEQVMAKVEGLFVGQ